MPEVNPISPPSPANGPNPWGLALAGLGALGTIFGANSAQERMRRAAQQAMQALDIPFYMKGEKLGKKFASWLASRYPGMPTNTFQSYAAISASPIGHALSLGRAGNPYAAPLSQTQESQWDTMGTRANAYEGLDLSKMALGGLLSEQAQRSAFQQWKNQQMLNILAGARENSSALGSQYLGALQAAGAALGGYLNDLFPGQTVNYAQPSGWSQAQAPR